jgi:hypothetical protein
VFIPKELIKQLRTVLQGEMKAVKQQMLSNVSGGVLNRKTGGLAKNITARSRVFNQSKVWARAGTKYYIGRFWEYGFVKNGKQYRPKQWATPIVNANAARVQQIMERTINSVYAKRGF